jgi:branched-subunit amino acid transport protein AzlD
MVSYLGGALPPAIMVILVLYCLRGIRFASFPHGLPELLSAVIVVAVQFWKKNTILSVALGTACYMCLIRTVFQT